VAQDVQGLRVALGEEGEAGVALERAVEVADRAVDPGREGGPGESRPDRLRHLPGRRALGHLADTAVGERHPDGAAHGPSSDAGGATAGVRAANAK